MSDKKHRKIRLTPVSSLHYFKLIFRSMLLVFGIVCYITGRVTISEEAFSRYPAGQWFLRVIWVIFVWEMLQRFFPSGLESPGCQKQFAKNYIKTGETDVRIDDNNAAILVALLWVTLNGFLGVLKLNGILDDSIMMLICLLYSVCDMICILFYCPFQSIFLKNKCCAACRIYNWDYAMMFTPLFFVKGLYSGSLLVLSVILLFRWEITVVRHPERFSERTNGYLTCKNCSEKLCTHKKQLWFLWKELESFTLKRIEKLRK